MPAAPKKALEVSEGLYWRDTRAIAIAIAEVFFFGRGSRNWIESTGEGLESVVICDYDATMH